MLKHKFLNILLMAKIENLKQLMAMLLLFQRVTMAEN